jgi:predicted transcriptional regulator
MSSAERRVSTTIRLDDYKRLNKFAESLNLDKERMCSHAIHYYLNDIEQRLKK